jgi:outer membrane immunogenic protein
VGGVGQNPTGGVQKPVDVASILLNVAAMKQLIRLMAVLFAFGALATAAFAGTEMYRGKESKAVAPAPAPECDFNWTGFYVGGNGGYAWGNGDTDFDPLPDPTTFALLRPTTLNPDPSGFIGGGQVGYNWQWNKWLVLGLETDFQGTDIEGHEIDSPIIENNGTAHVPPGFLASHERLQWFGTGRGRIGFVPVCRLMIYATGGVAYGNVDYSANTNFGKGGFSTYPTNFTETKAGWTVGGGLEYAISNHWSVRAEYLYYDLGDEDRTANQLTAGVPQGPPFFVHYNFDTTGNIVRGGLNFKF